MGVLAVLTRRPLLRFSLAAGFALAVLVASMIRAPPVVAELGPFGLFPYDKWIHAGSYALVAFLTAYTLLTRSLLVLAAIGIFTILFGAGVEVIQRDIPYRSMESGDLLANAIGTVVALLVWRICWTVWTRRRDGTAE